MKRPQIDSSEDTITESALMGSAAKVVPAGAVLCVMRSGILRHSFPVAVNTVDVTLNQDMRALVPHAGVDPNFIAHFLRRSTWDILNQCSKAGTTVNSIEAGRLEIFPVPLPPLDTQRRIVARIDELFSELDDGESALARARADLETYRKSLLKAAVTGELTADWRAANPPAETGEQLLQHILADRKAHWEADPKNKGKPYKEPELSSFDAELELPSGWSTCTPEAVCHFITKGTTPPKNLHSEGSASVIPFLRVTNLTTTGALNLDDLQFVSEDIHEGFLGRSICEVNDVLMNIVGPPLGQVSIVPDDYPSWNINQAIARFRPLYGITAEFLALTLQSGLVQGWLVKRAKTTAGQVNLTLELCRTVPIPLPPIGEQAECVRIFEAKDQALRELINWLEPSANLRQSILAAAFRGELAQ